MFIKNLKLNNFRNYESQEFNFSDKINIIHGDNAQGKTNCAEAIFYLCTGYSPRATKDKQVIKNGENLAKISGIASSIYGDISVDMTFHSNQNKDILVNGVQIKKVGELLGNINSVFFNPSELKLIQESPEDRRRFLDISLSQMKRNYFYALSRYKKILLQRNNLLKDEDKELIKETLPVWDIQLVQAGAKIIKCRNDYITKLSPLAKEVHYFITDGKEEFDVSSEREFVGDEVQIQQNLLDELTSRLEKDMILGYTTCGPHRDDLKLKVNGESVKVYGSQGQQRTCALSLKLAELEIFKDYFGEYPTLILDDAMSELDLSRQKRLIERIKDVQTIITCVSVDERVFDGVKYSEFVVQNGKLL